MGKGHGHLGFYGFSVGGVEEALKWAETGQRRPGSSLGAPPRLRRAPGAVPRFATSHFPRSPIPFPIPIPPIPTDARIQ